MCAPIFVTWAISQRAGKTRQYYLKVVFVNHKRSHFGTGVALIVGDLRGRPECPNLAELRQPI